MNENDKLHTLLALTKKDFDALDAEVKAICRSRATAEAPPIVAEALLDGVTNAIECLESLAIDRTLASDTPEFRELVRKALSPEIRRRIKSYKRRFPHAIDVFDECEWEALGWLNDLLDDLIHPADFKMLVDAVPGQYEACHLPE